MSNAEKVAWIASMCCIFGSCASRGHYTSETILEYQRKIGSLESTIERVDRLMSESTAGLREITERSAGMEDEIDGIINEFDKYQLRVERLLREYQEIRRGK